MRAKDSRGGQGPAAQEVRAQGIANSQYGAASQGVPLIVNTHAFNGTWCLFFRWGDAIILGPDFDPTWGD